jgi:integrase
MARAHLTERDIRALEAPDPTGTQQVYWDTHTIGLGVKVSGTTAVKTFVVKGKVRGSDRSPVLAIGRAAVDGGMTLADARREAGQIRAAFYSGVNPRAEQAAAVTLRQAMNAYLEARKANLKPRTLAGYRQETERHLGDWLDRPPLKDITPAMCEARHKAIAAGIAGKRHYVGGATADRVMKSFQVFWNYAAERTPALGPCPVKILKHHFHKIKPRERCLKANEFAKFFKAVQELPSAVAKDYVVTLLFTGLRRREASRIRWGDVDIDAKTLTIPAANTKNSRKLVLPLSDVIYALLKRRRALGKTQYVFPATGSSGHIQEPKFHFGQIAKATGITVSAHDLRRSYVTVAESCDIGIMALAALVNHVVPGVTSQYVQMNVDRLRVPAQVVTDKLKVLCKID